MNLDVRAAARLLGVSEERVYEWADQGFLPSVEMRDQLRFNRVELLEWAAARKMKVAAELFSDDRRPANGGFKLSKALRAGGIQRDVAGMDDRAVLTAIIGLLPMPAGIDRETIAALFVARGGVSAVGDGIAIPHARAPVILPMKEPLVALGLPARAIDMKAPDGKPVKALFVVLSPTIRVHLQVLARVASALVDRDLHALVERRASNDEILQRIEAIEAGEGKPAGASSAGAAP